MNFLEFVPDTDLNKLFRARRQEYVQPLQELGYLTANQDDIPAALQAFRRDYLAFQLIPNYTYAIIYDANWTNEPDALELALLHEITSLEGDFHIPFLPKLGDQNILTRILHYRLALLGLFSKTAAAEPYSIQTSQALLDLRKWLLRDGEAADLLQIVYLTGNINDLIRMLVRTDKLREHLVHFEYNAPTHATKHLRKLTSWDEDMQANIAEIQQEELVEAEAFSPENDEQLDQEIDKAIGDALENKTATVQAKIDELEADETLKANEIRETANAIIKLEDTSPESKPFTPEINRRQRRWAEKEVKIGLAIDVLLERLTKHQEVHLLEIETVKRAILTQQKEVAKWTKIVEKGDADKIALKAILKEYNDAKRGLKKKFKNRSTTDIQASLDNLHNIVTIRQRNINRLELNPRRNRNALNVNRNMIKDERRNLRDFLQEIHSREALSRLEKKAVKQGLLVENASLDDARKALKDKRGADEKQLEVATKILEKLQNQQTNLHAELNEETNTLQGKIRSKVKRLRQLQRKLSGMKRGFSIQLQESMDSLWLRTHRRAIFRENDLSFLETAEAKNYNNFLLYLIQTHQYLRGYYYGAIDGDFGAMTHASIRDICKDTTGLHHRRILMPLRTNQAGKTIWILNGAYFFEAMAFMLPDRNAAEKERLLDAYEDLLNEIPLGDGAHWAVQAWEEYVAQIDSDLERGKWRRVYYGTRKLARNTWRALKRFSSWIGKVFKERIAPVFRNLMKTLCSELSEGLQTYLAGMRFLFGERLLETKGANGLIISTKYDFDFDAVVAIPKGVEAKVLKQHALFNHQQAANLDFTMRVTGKVLSIALFAVKVGVNWQAVALDIAIGYRRKLRPFLRKMVVRTAFNLADKLILN